jgi:hypothetical protein
LLGSRPRSCAIVSTVVGHFMDGPPLSIGRSLRLEAEERDG